MKKVLGVFTISLMVAVCAILLTTTVSTSAPPAPSGMITGQLQPGILAASALGRALVAANFFDTATLAAKIANDAITAAVVEAKFAAGAISATVDGRAALADGYFDSATLGLKIVDGAFTEAICTDEFAASAIEGTKIKLNATGALAGNMGVGVDELGIGDNALTTAVLGAKINDNAITTAVIDDEFNNNAFTSAHFSGAEIKFTAAALDEAGVDSLFADDAFDAEDFVAAAGGIFATGCLDTTAIANVVADDAFTTTEFGAGAGGKFAAGALAEVGVDNLFADDSIDAEDFVAGAGGIFAADCFDATAIGNVFAANSWSSANVAAKVADGALAEAKLQGAAFAAATVIATPIYMISLEFDPADFVPSAANNDVPIYNVNSPSLYLLEAKIMISVAEGAADTLAIFTDAGGGGTRLSGDMNANAVALNNEGGAVPTAANRALAAGSSLFLHGSSNIGTAQGTLLLMVRTNQ